MEYNGQYYYADSTEARYLKKDQYFFLAGEPETVKFLGIPLYKRPKQELYRIKHKMNHYSALIELHLVSVGTGEDYTVHLSPSRHIRFYVKEQF